MNLFVIIIYIDNRWNVIAFETCFVQYEYFYVLCFVNFILATVFIKNSVKKGVYLLFILLQFKLSNLARKK